MSKKKKTKRPVDGNKSTDKKKNKKDKKKKTINLKKKRTEKSEQSHGQKFAKKGKSFKGRNKKHGQEKKGPKTTGEIIQGEIQKNMRGFGFVITPEDESDIFIARRDMGGAMNGDVVSVALLSERKDPTSPEGIVIDVTKRAFSRVVGEFVQNKGYGFVIAADKKIKEDIFIDGKNFNGAKDGDFVVAKIIKYPMKRRSAEGSISEIIAKGDDPTGDVKAILAQNEIRDDFPDEVENEAKFLDKRGVSDDAKAGRRDLRDLVVVTIDGADSKDFDDGVSCTKLENGNYSLGVHIADVAHYVHESSALDLEALDRGNSIYLLDKVVPMLPFELSNGLCSLNPKVDRLTLTCQMEINSEGEVVAHDIFESVIKSTERLVYEDVSDIYEKDDEKLKKKYAHILEDLLNMKDLAKILETKREARGSIDFDLTEARIFVDENGVPTDIRTVERRSSNKMIEEFMLKANEVVAHHFADLKVPFLYRVHKRPEPEKIRELSTFMDVLGAHIKGGLKDVSPKQLSSVLADIKGEEYAKVVSTVMLRTMQKAYYDVECLGHFGLALDYYTHFTSPIRRYSDLFIHRVIKAYLNGTLDEKKTDFREKAQAAATATSLKERETIELERDIEKLKKCQFMENFVGNEYEGVISGVTNYGIYVELENTVEGMVRMEELRDDFYEFDQANYLVMGRTTKKVYRLGDKVRIAVSRVDTESRQIDFSLI